jgi:hypothetical protein
VDPLLIIGLLDPEPYCRYFINSVADLGCLSRIPDPKTAKKERGEKKFVVIPFYVATNFTEL